MDTNGVQRIDDGVVVIDLNHQGQQHASGSWLVQGEQGWVIIDCGPTPTRAFLERGVHAAGLEMGDIERIVTTHIHLDHAGGASVLLREYPHLRLSVHRDSAAFLIDPSRLIRSATMSFGDRMERLWGEVTTIDPNRVDTMVPGERVPGTSLQVIAAPGHTNTHVVFLDPDRNLLFAGDAAHARLPESDLIIPTLAPAELDFDAWATTAQTLQQLRPAALALPHFGLVTDAEAHLARLVERTESRREIAGSIVRSPQDLPELIAAIEAATRAEYAAEGGDVDAKIQAMEWAMPSYLGGQGILRWYTANNRFPA